MQDAIQKLLKDHKYNLYVVTVNILREPRRSRRLGQGRRDKKAHGQGRCPARHLDSRPVQLCDELRERHQRPSSRTSARMPSRPIWPAGKKDYAQAAIDTAAAIGDAAGGGSGNVPSGNGAGAGVLVGTGVVVAGGAGAYLYFRNRRKKAAQASSASYGPAGRRTRSAGFAQHRGTAAQERLAAHRSR